MFYGSKQVNGDGETSEAENVTTPVEFPEVKNKVISDSMHVSSNIVWLP